MDQVLAPVEQAAKADQLGAEVVQERVAPLVWQVLALRLAVAAVVPAALLRIMVRQVDAVRLTSNGDLWRCKTYALVENGIVVNTIVWDGDTQDWSPQSGQTAVLVPANAGPVSIGWTYSNGVFSVST
nr:hypothetical protein [Paraburkholderia sp. SOS3]